jgi:hypothetical protein
MLPENLKGCSASTFDHSAFRRRFGNHVYHRSVGIPWTFSKRFAVAALGGASIIAIVAALVAAQTSPANASCTSLSSNNVTGNCAGPITPISGIFSNTGSIGGGTIGVNIGSDISISNLSNGSIGSNGSLSFVHATVTSTEQAAARGIYNEGTIGSLSNNGTIIGEIAPSAASTRTMLKAFGVSNIGSIGGLTNSGQITAISSAPSIAGILSNFAIENDGGFIGSITNLTGASIIATSSARDSDGIHNVNGGNIASIYNSGSIVGGGSATYLSGIYNDVGGTIDTLMNSSLGLIAGHAVEGIGQISAGMFNKSFIGTIQNDGWMSGGVSAVSNSGIRNFDNSTISVLTNNGTISAENFGIHNQGSIGNLSNYNSINAFGNDPRNITRGIVNRLEIAVLFNSGTISASGSGINVSGIFNAEERAIGTLTNTGKVSATNYRAPSGTSTYAIGINNKGSIGHLSNSGTISANAPTVSSDTNKSYVFGILNGVLDSNDYDVINNINNTGIVSASGSQAYAIWNDGSLHSLINSGSIYTNGGTANRGIVNNNIIDTLTNMGVINGAASEISNNDRIGTLINAQGGNGSLPAQTALTYSGNLPGTYLEYVTSRTHYGQLAVTGGAGTIGSFGIAEGSTLANGTYASVLSGVGTVGAISGTNGSIMGSVSVGSGLANWTLLNMGSDIWDLIISGLVSGADAVNTLIELGFTRDEILEALRGRAAAMNNALNYDCMTFNENGVCISFNARYTSLNDMNDGAGVMKAALRLSPTTHVGAFIDYAGKPETEGVLAYEDGMPMFGGFLGYRQQPDGTGLKAHIAAARHTDDVTITRSATLENTEAGSGSSSLTNWAIGAELGYGLALSNQSNLTPYIGLRYGTAEMDGYAEGSSETVEYPITLNAFSQNLTTATAGLRLDGMLGDQLAYEIAGGLEYDLKSDANAFSGSSTIPDLTTFSLENTADSNRLRGSGSIALGYAIAPNQKLTTSVSVRGEAYSDKVDTNVMAGYQIQF